MAELLHERTRGMMGEQFSQGADVVAKALTKAATHKEEQGGREGFMHVMGVLLVAKTNSRMRRALRKP